MRCFAYTLLAPSAILRDILLLQTLVSQPNEPSNAFTLITNHTVGNFNFHAKSPVVFVAAFTAPTNDNMSMWHHWEKWEKIGRGSPTFLLS